MTVKSERLVRVPMFLNPRTYLDPVVAEMILSLPTEPMVSDRITIMARPVTTTKDTDGWPMDVYCLKLLTD